MASTYNQVTVTSTPTLIVAANNRRRQLIFDNQSSSVSIWVGHDANITTTNTIRMLPGARYESDGNYARIAIYGVTASSTATVGYWEIAD